MEPIRSAAELYAHAIAVEREAAERYAEFAQRMNDLGDESVGALFARLARLEEEHLGALERRTAGLALPWLETHEYRWLDAGAPETVARDLVYLLMTPHNALAIALGAEKRAQAFFERVLVEAQDPALRALAREMAADEREHVAMIEGLLQRTPEALVDWASVYQMN
ncbi:MAG TPA: ferritin family protein [Burkholderiales bacterium]|nr:ferritin family protein [Burkholderiales bacterium]